MNKNQLSPFDSPPEKPSIVKQVAIKLGVVGATVAVTLGFVQWQAQQAKLDAMAEMVAQLQEQNSQDIVARAASLDLTAVQPTAEPVAPTPVVAPAPVTVAAPVVAPQPVTDQQDIARDARKIETLATINAGVERLVAAVVEGNYDIHTNYSDEHFSGRIHFAFIGQEASQVELEQFISNAAEEGLIAYSNSVVDGDGKVNGHIMLFDLVERALENGTPEEQAAGKKMQQAALDMLAADGDVTVETTDAGERYYVVEPGDSLAYISLQFYGDTGQFSRIYNANRDQLRSPELINVGQRLLIPEA